MVRGGSYFPPFFKLPGTREVQLVGGGFPDACSVSWGDVPGDEVVLELRKRICKDGK